MDFRDKCTEEIVSTQVLFEFEVLEDEITDDIEEEKSQDLITIDLEAFKRREKYKDRSIEKPSVTIKSISMTGEIVLGFSNEMYVPQNYTQLKGDSKQTNERSLETISEFLTIEVIRLDEQN